MAKQNDEQLKKVNAIRATLATQGWQLIDEEFDKAIASATEMILTGKDVNGNDLDESEIKSARILLAVWKKAKSLPASIVDENTPSEAQPVDEDVYYQADDLTKK